MNVNIEMRYKYKFLKGNAKLYNIYQITQQNNFIIYKIEYNKSNTGKHILQNIKTRHSCKNMTQLTET